MDPTERYIQLARRGRDAFLREAAPAALYQRREPGSDSRSGILGPPRSLTHEDDTVLARLEGTLTNPQGASDFRIFPLIKKPGAPFADMIMIGRTANNDIVLKDVTISRFHAFFREQDKGWVVCDAGSKNGTSLNDAPLAPRKEQVVKSGDVVTLGEVVTTFYTAPGLFDVLAEAM